MENELNKTLIEIRNNARSSILSPTNCFSIDNPNELHIINDKLIGIFFPSKLEEKNPLLLLRRILNSKLVYSNILQIALFISENNPLLEYRDIKNSADILIHEGEQDSILKRLKHPAEKTISFSAMTKQKSIRHFYNNLTFYEISKNRMKEYKSLILNEREIVQYRSNTLNSQHIMSQKVWVGDKSYKIYVKNSEKPIISIARSLQSFLTYTFFLHFQIEDFHIRESSSFVNSFAFYNMREIKDNPNIIQRLCFAGFIPSEISSIDECIDLIGIFQNYGKKR